jgi:SHS2 domain-containing protein
VWGRQLVDLFEAAATGMYDMMAELDGLVATRWREVELKESDNESLLVEWLNELLFLTETEEWLPFQYQIRSLEAGALRASVGGIPGTPVLAKIKAATYHELAIVPDERGWSTSITFDV